MRRKKLKPTLHSIYKSQKYQPKVMLHRIPKAILTNYVHTLINTVSESTIQTSVAKSESSPFEDVPFIGPVEPVADYKTIDPDKGSIVSSNTSDSPSEYRNLTTLKATSTMSAQRVRSALAKSKNSITSFKSKNSFPSPQRPHTPLKSKSPSLAKKSVSSLKPKSPSSSVKGSGSTMKPKSPSSSIKGSISALKPKSPSSSMKGSPQTLKLKSPSFSSVKDSLSPYSSEQSFSKFKSPTSILKTVNQSASKSKSKPKSKINKAIAHKEVVKKARIVKTHSLTGISTALQKPRKPATLKLGPDMVKDLDEILSTVEDAVIAETRLLSTVEDALLGEASLSSPESSDQVLEMNGTIEENSELIHTVKKENIELPVGSPKSKSTDTTDKIERQVSIDNPSGKCSTESTFESDGFHNNSEHSHSDGEPSMPPSPRPWLTPKIVSVSSMAAQAVDNFDTTVPAAEDKQRVCKQILTSRSLSEISPPEGTEAPTVVLKETVGKGDKQTIQKLPPSHFAPNVNSKEMKKINNICKSKMNDSLYKLLRVVAQLRRMPSIKKECSDKCVELQKVVKELGIDDDLFSKLSIIIKDSVHESEQYSQNAKYILQLINNYSRDDDKSEMPVD